MADSPINDSVEIWKPVPGWEGLYSVSNLGNVRSEPKTVDVLTRWGHKAPRRWPAKLLSQQPCMGTRMGYMQVHFKSKGYREAHYVHRLVCRTFYGEAPTNSHQAAHGDGAPLNNKLSNLRWATPEENLADKMGHGNIPKGEKHSAALFTEADVIEIKKAADHTRDAEFAERFGASPLTVRLIRLGHSWKHVKV